MMLKKFLNIKNPYLLLAKRLMKMQKSCAKDVQNLINLSMFYAVKNPVDEASSADFLGENRTNIDIKELPNGNIILTVLDNPKDN